MSLLIYLLNYSQEYSHSFRIARETKFINLKKAAVEYWDLEKEEKKGERVSSTLELFDDEGNRMTNSSGNNDDSDYLNDFSEMTIHSFYAQKVEPIL